MVQARVESPATDGRRELRAGFARELHDGPIQALTRCVVRLERFRLVNENPEMQAAISEVEGDARVALASLRDMIRDLRDMAPKEDLATTIRTFARRHQAATGVEVTVIVSPAWPDLLRSEHALNLLRIVQEAITNAIRHGRAGHVVIELQACDGELAVSISDDGLGIEPGTPAGAGMLGMRERAALVGGRLVVHGRHPGTEIRVEMPVR